MIFYIGSYTHLGGAGITVCELKQNKFKILSIAQELANPTYLILSKNKKVLYAVGEDKKTNMGVVASYTILKDRLSLLSLKPTKGNSPCHLTLSNDEHTLYVANYSSGSVAVFPLSDGVLGESTQLMIHQGCSLNPIRQDAAHTHMVTFRPNSNELFVVDLGLDAIVIYFQDLQTGYLAEKERIQVKPGMGPRHLVFADENTFYLAHELENAVSMYQRTENKWMCKQTLSTLPPTCTKESYASAIKIHSRKLFVSNRGYDSIACYDIDSKGKLNLNSILPIDYQFPRDFAFLKDDNLLIAFQNSDILILAKKTNNNLQEISSISGIKGAVCVCAN